MRIVQVVPTIGPGGAETLAFELAREFARRGHESELVAICGARGSRGKRMLEVLLAEGVKVVDVGARSPRSLPALVKFLRVMRIQRSAVVVAHLFSSEIYVAAAKVTRRSRSAQTFAVFHNSIIRTKERLWANLAGRLGLSYIGCSRGAVQGLAAIGVSALQIDNGIRVSTEGALDRAKTKNVGILMIGNLRGGLSGQKGVDIALKAARALPSNCHLTIAGLPDAEIGVIRQVIADYGLCDSVSAVGSFDSFHGLVCQLNPSLLWMPSRYEGLPMVLMEASTLGIPVVASDIPAITDIHREEFMWTFFETGSHDDLAKATARLVNQLQPADDRAKQLYMASARDAFAIVSCAERYELAFSLAHS